MLKVLLFFGIPGHQSHSFLSSGLWALVNNAGILGLPADGELIPMTGYKKCMAVNFFGAVEVTKAFLPLLRKSKGRLVNISSMAGESAFPHKVVRCLLCKTRLFAFFVGQTRKQDKLLQGWVKLIQIVCLPLILIQ